ncbi:hypothetical protein BATDEDRAFT_92858 [Batrachochytrium dendrobatidis JAM81]|uniref:SCP2 domain-containing protein n=2 Tax=Batrachochytrium dendrobatidis TaxID=109871 RepID=F4PEL8_BATDJ|nr:uncharacterized protein BATDEDRAFT_92858 [Batrachochytrium dendrobatidis JAM81]EGF76267.1 hypothetical protein BATDEDRAFT_92858 [Batrachochytrium dendrobatidis JAM81]KAJ8323670.1 hypothetical protein O5D80_007559 [Batrachochytrium dendrobatidis]KAK5666410.1 hypothetical protein QVD99_007165 [Batrachochytrium dendrobatidis]OAJ43032.1 hypothetical protein BDEG_26416 [Batrachochytrium dendrobatidis JEL423]|eukprot:XP_006683097.1 hypothetical protein BATDEDRAFT_92858 [Batrachochytrium dendrobatidis JAM81]
MSQQTLDEFQRGKRPEKSLHASLLFPEIARKLSDNPTLLGNLSGLFIVTVLKRGEKKDDWYLLFRGQDAKPLISQTRPSLPQLKGNEKPLPMVAVEIEDRDIYKFITGGMHGLKALTQNRVKIAGDLLLAQQLEEVFYKTGGVDQVRAFMEKAASRDANTRSKL